MFWAKVFTSKTEIVVAICDEELLDKSIEFKRKNVRIKISKHFYGGNLVDEKDAIKLLNDATIGNLIGKSIVKLAQKNGFIAKNNIININGIPHAQFVKL